MGVAKQLIIYQFAQPNSIIPSRFVNTARPGSSDNKRRKRGRSGAQERPVCLGTCTSNMYERHFRIEFSHLFEFINMNNVGERTLIVGPSGLQN